MKIGILGGGQLGRMLVQAAIPLDIDISVMDKSVDFPTPDIWPYFQEGDFTNYDHVMEFGRTVDAITIEIESVNIEALYDLEREGKVIFPQPHILDIIADKGLQKNFYKEHNLPTSSFILCDGAEIKDKVESGELALPFVQKVRKGGYDGRGVHVVQTIDDLQNLLHGPSVVESLVEIQKEIAVIVCRGRDGNISHFPVVEMSFHPTANLVEFLFSPSNLSLAKQKEAIEISRGIAEQMGIYGLLAVELFEDVNGNILINEVAPRPHNSGHHTIEACITSQYEQLIRVLSNFPQGETDLIQPSVMVNLLGEEGYAGIPVFEGLGEILGMKGVYPHIYGKTTTKPFRKMGHVTVMSNELPEAIRLAQEVKSILKVKA
ncbi:MAG TPA: 5-(carboxyamino)imidazole ribonucleotide synthase [Saprospiraceae bacterium]|nr:5-(carboxyamino)imidazole ribonucleotide synthase [Saprospiraceae bacterium]